MSALAEGENVLNGSAAEAEPGAHLTSAPPASTLVRYAPLTVSRRASGTGSLATLEGYVTNWQDRVEIRSPREGHFIETFAPTAFDEGLVADRGRVRALYGHGQDPVYGTLPIGPLSQLHADNVGLWYAIDLFDTPGNRSLLLAAEAGLLSSSLRFSVQAEQVRQKPPRSSYNPAGITEVTYLKARVRELGPTPLPANAAATATVRPAGAPTKGNPKWKL